MSLDVESLTAALAARRDAALADPFANPLLLYALDLARGLQRDEDGLAGLQAAVAELTETAFAERAKRLADYLDGPGPGRGEAKLAVLFERLAEAGFEAYARLLASTPVNVVFTGHPTFSMTRERARLLVGQACGQAGADGPALSHRPAAEITLDDEQAWVLEALGHAADALDRARRIALEVGRRHWPDRWRTLDPRLAVFYSWVGFDQDGRTDVTWMVSLKMRLSLKAAGLRRRLAALGELAPEATTRLEAALETVSRQQALLDEALVEPQATPAMSRAMVEGRARALVDPAPLIADLDTAIAAADDQAAERLLAMRAGLALQGLSLARIHIRLNAAELHAAVRREVDLETDPDDPARRRSYFAAVDSLIGRAKTEKVSYASLLREPSAARRAMMAAAQMRKHVDQEPVRFLIAEAESGFTLLTALYYARQFGVDDLVEISPLFETEEALSGGEELIRQALKSPRYRTYVKAQGKLAVEFGFSDSGRFIGQMAATFRIERLRLRLAELMKAEHLTKLEIVLFNTHGESIGRGGHPLSLADRLAYVAPPRSRAEFAERGITAHEEVSFQGGEGYLPFFSPEAAMATVAGVLECGFPHAETAVDPIYYAPDFASEFFATVQQEMSRLVADPDYAALLSLFGTRMLFKTGSRPTLRDTGDQGRPKALRGVGELRAISNNGVLHQLGWLATTTHGAGRAAAKDPGDFLSMRRSSQRFHRAIEMVEAARSLGDIDAARGYAALLDPAMWLDLRRHVRTDAEADCFDSLVEMTEKADHGEALERVLRTLRADAIRLDEALRPRRTPRRERIRLLHTIRLAVLMRIGLLAVRIPDFAPNRELTHDAVVESLLRMEIPSTVAKLKALFPLHPETQLADADFGEPSSWRPMGIRSHAVEHERLFEPLLQLHALALDITAALTHEIGAVG
jgi:phosphoenolpyruvate carboxylase